MGKCYCEQWRETHRYDAGKYSPLNRMLYPGLHSTIFLGHSYYFFLLQKMPLIFFFFPLGAALLFLPFFGATFFFFLAFFELGGGFVLFRLLAVLSPHPRAMFKTLIPLFTAESFNFTRFASTSGFASALLPADTAALVAGIW